MAAETTAASSRSASSRSASSPAAPDRGLAHVPAGAFAIAMGVGGTAVAWQRFGTAFGWGAGIGTVLAWIALGVLIVVAGAYIAKVARYPRAALAEWTHPVRSAFVAASAIAMLVLAIAFLPMNHALSAGLWWAGAALQAVITVLVMRNWIADSRIEHAHVHPAWFIPVVGNLVAPLAGVEHAPAELNWYFFGVGAVYWLGLLPVVLQRLFVAGFMPPRLAPTLAILVAPPSVAALAWVRLGGSWDDPLARVLLAVVVFQLALLASQANALRRVPFAVSSWAYTFPLAAAASALLVAANAGAADVYRWIGAVAVTAASVLVLGLAVRTVIAGARGELLRAEG
ncbi:SLAC1 anion channel family protein [Demequina sp.]|uniref:SLAC1 anion channel family protein n=1 Tax=Demequina sp. TaxID=2050685 RepID=UPI0025E8E19F|nr:SLAC1 anion channel family protein [Demequina sp.]